MASITLVIGGSGSGKSEFAEDLVVHEFGKKYYIATMRAFGDADYEKIEKHKKGRANKNFISLEWDKEFQSMPANSCAVIECMGTFCANWLFDTDYETAFYGIKNELCKVFESCTKIVVVSNDVFSDGRAYPKETRAYIKLLSEINRWIGATAENIIEVVYSIPVCHKGGIYV